MSTQAFPSTAHPVAAAAKRIVIQFNGSIGFDRFMHLVCDEWKMPCRLVKLNIVYQDRICLGDLQLDLLGTDAEQQLFLNRLRKKRLSFLA